MASRPDVFLRMAEVNGGELLIVERPGEIVDYVPHMSLTRISEIGIDNLTSGEAARAVRLFPDGTFDSYAPLVPGENRLRITVRGDGGGVLTLERTVLFEKTTDTARLRELLDLLRARTLETQLAEEARRKRAIARKRTLEIIVEDR